MSSVSLFGGAVTASGVSGTGGRGTVTGLRVEGVDVGIGPGQVVAVGKWAQVTVERKVGRARAILVLNLLAPHGSLPAGTIVAIGYEAAPQPTAKTMPTPQPSHPQADGQSPPNADHTEPASKASPTHVSKRRQQQPPKPPPDYPASPSPLKADGNFTDAVQDNPVVATALQYLGIPYQWGGASPKTGFDCSGLVQYVFAQLGVSLVHYAAAQYRSPETVWIPPDRLRPGDLVFFTGADGTRKAPGHVGIYVEDGYIIDAPHSGTLVRIDSLNDPQLANQYVGAKRVDTQLIDARHLLHATKSKTSASDILRGFPQVMTIASVGDSLRIAAAGDTPSRSWLWGGVVLGGLLLPLCTGSVLVRRRRPPNASPSGETSP